MPKTAPLARLIADELAGISQNLRSTRIRGADLLSPSATEWLHAVESALADLAAPSHLDEWITNFLIIDSWVLDGILTDNGTDRRKSLAATRRQIVIALNDDAQRLDPPADVTSDELADRLLGVLRRTYWDRLSNKEVLARARVALHVLHDHLEKLEEADDIDHNATRDDGPDTKHYRNRETTARPPRGVDPTRTL